MKRNVYRLFFELAKYAASSRQGQPKAQRGENDLDVALAYDNGKDAHRDKSDGSEDIDDVHDSPLIGMANVA